MEEHLAKLSQFEFLDGLEPSFLEELDKWATWKVLPPDTYIFNEGDPANHFYLVAAGRIAIQIESDTCGALGLQSVKPGEVFGWSWIVPPFKNRFSAKTVIESRIVCIDGSQFRSYCESHPEMGYELLKRFIVPCVQRLNAARLHILDLHKRWNRQI